MSAIGIGVFLPIMILGGLLLTLLILSLSGQGHSDTARTLGRVIRYVLFGMLGLLCLLLVMRMGLAPMAGRGSGPVRAVALPSFVFLLAFVGIVLTVLLVNKTTRKVAAVILLVGLGVLVIGGFFVGFERRVARPAATATLPPARPDRVMPVPPIWSAGVADELDADIYPSKESAVRVLGRRMAGLLGQRVDEPNGIRRIVVFQQDNEQTLAGALASALGQAMPQVHAFVENRLRNLSDDEVGMELRQITTAMPLAPWSRISGQETVSQGRIEVTALIGSSGTTINESFIEKPWVQDFSIFANSHPNHEFAVARSNEACVNESEARQQALAEATRLTMQAVRDRIHGPGSMAVNPSDLQDMGIVADTFIQSFHGTAGPIWRQAVLLDFSPEKLTTLAQARMVQTQLLRKSWAGMIAQGVGVFVVIFLAYLFLNMATRGYYDWALRVAGLVLAVAVMAFLFLHA